MAVVDLMCCKATKACSAVANYGHNVYEQNTERKLVVFLVLTAI